MKKHRWDLISLGKTTEDIDYIVDTVAVHLNLSFDERQDILETSNLYERLIKIINSTKRNRYFRS